jgi:hypothetical protein
LESKECINIKEAKLLNIGGGNWTIYNVFSRTQGLKMYGKTVVYRIEWNISIGPFQVTLLKAL